MLGIAACRPLAPEDAVPAVLVAPDPAVQAELIAALSAMLGPAAISIAPDALTRTSLLTLERPEPGGGSERRATGRSLETPERFRLVASRDGCFLVHETGVDRVELHRATCVPEADRPAPAP